MNKICCQLYMAKIATAAELASLLLVEKYFLASSFPDVYALPACCSSLLPLTVASFERSFSKLKLIKNYLRSTIYMSQERLSDLAMLSIENTRAKKLNVSNIIDVFAELKARRKDLK